MREFERRLARLESHFNAAQAAVVWDAEAHARVMAELRALPPESVQQHAPKTVEQVRQALVAARAMPKSTETVTDYRALRIQLLETELREAEVRRAQQAI